MHKIAVVLSALLLGLTAPSAYSGVNLRNMSFTEHWSDTGIKFSNGEIATVKRFYSSRNESRGIFGLGWCSDYETRLEFDSDAFVSFVHCGAGLEESFYPVDVPRAYKMLYLDKISAAIDASGSGDQRAMARLDTMRLDADDAYLWAVAWQLGIEVYLPQMSIYQSTRGALLRREGDRWRATLSNGEYLFDRTGRLLHRKPRSGVEYTLRYEAGRLRALVYPEGNEIEFEYDATGQLSHLRQDGDTVVDYTFDAADRLMHVSNAWKAEYFYEYNDNDKLIGVKFPDDTWIRMTYDDKFNPGNIASYENRLACREDYYADGNPRHFRVYVWRKCDDGTDDVDIAYHEFRYGKHGLEQVIEFYPDRERKIIDYEPVTGRATRIRQGGVDDSLVYDAASRVMKSLSKETSWALGDLDGHCGRAQTFHQYGSGRGLVAARALRGSDCEIHTLAVAGIGIVRRRVEESGLETITLDASPPLKIDWSAEEYTFLDPKTGREEVVPASGVWSFLESSEVYKFDPEELAIVLQLLQDRMWKPRRAGPLG